MSWEEPEFESVNMSAEIGAYYDDLAGQTPAASDPPPPLIDPPVAAGAERSKGRDQ